MRAVIQKSKESFVNVDGKCVGKIEKGLVVLVAFTEGDSIKEIDYMINKVINMRIFDGTPEQSLLEVGGDILVISQFTLYADAAKGRRPSYVKALKSEEANKLYELFVQRLKETGIKVETGIFGADMDVHINNPGPCTIILDSI
jgi:D-tyrosyl-tRNA(Tyr) deacylase